LDEFELNRMNVYEYDVVLMFVNDMKKWSRHSILLCWDY